MAESKSLAFHVEIDNALPRTFTSDPKRLQQILKNLLSNAFKFTSQGQVAMRVQPVTSGWSPDHPDSRLRPARSFAIEVSDTGIGIAAEKQRLIFEAFQQADAGTSRKYGGTGLGLAISRELATLLGGEIRLVSTPGQGSTFTLYLPLSYTGPARAVTAPASPTPADAARRRGGVAAGPRRRQGRGGRARRSRRHQRGRHGPADRRRRLRTTPGCCSGWRATRASRASSRTAARRRWRWPGSTCPTAITLDVFLPDMLGWTVLNNLKLDPATRHIPVQMLSVEEERQHGLSHGAFSYLVKPATTEDLEHAFDRIKTYVTPHKKRLLVIEDNDIERQSIVELLDARRHRDRGGGTGAEALEAARRAGRSTAASSTCGCPT